MPPDYALRPPRPGAARPQETATDEKAREAVFGTQQAESRPAPASGEEALLQSAGAANANPDIRTIVEQETAAQAPKEQPVAKRLLGFTLGDQDEGEKGTIVDPKAETERLRKDAEEGKPITEGETPVIEE
jgi:hypothetical protein